MALARWERHPDGRDEGSASAAHRARSASADAPDRLSAFVWIGDEHFFSFD